MRLGRKSEKLSGTLQTHIQPYWLIVLALALIAFLFAMACPVSADELLVNGGFESGTTGWSVAGGQLSATQEYVHGGQFAACLSSTDAAVKSFCQDVIVQPGSNYTFSGWAIMNSSNINTLYFQMRFLSEDGESLLDTRSAELTDNSPDYRILTVTEIAPSQAVTVQVKAEFRPASEDYTVAYFDDLSLDGPTPTLTPSPTPILSPSPTPTLTPSPTPTLMPSPTLTLTPSPTPILTPSPTPYLTSAWPGQVVVNEVMYNPVESSAEWIELFNRSGTTLALIGWTISDNVGTDIIPGLSLSPGGFVLVAADQASIPLNFTGLAVILSDGRIGNGLADSGDRLMLRDGTGKIIDALSYGDDTSIFTPACSTVAKGHSLERRSAGLDTDQASDFAENDQPSPGAAWVGPTPTPTPTLTLTPTLTPTPTPTPSPTPNLTPTLLLTPVTVASAKPDQTSSLTPVSEPPTTLPQTGDPELKNIFIAMVLLGSVLLFCGLWLWRRASS